MVEAYKQPIHLIGRNFIILSQSPCFQDNTQYIISLRQIAPLLHGGVICIELLVYTINIVSFATNILMFQLLPISPLNAVEYPNKSYIFVHEGLDIAMFSFNTLEKTKRLILSILSESGKFIWCMGSKQNVPRLYT